jgi:hypothetical protein
MGGGENYFRNPGDGQTNSQPADDSGYANLQKDSQDGFRHLDKSMLQRLNKEESDEQYIGRLGQMVRSYQDMLYTGRSSELTQEDTKTKNDAQRIISDLEKSSKYKSQPVENTNPKLLYGNAQLKALYGAQYDNSNQTQNKPQEVKTQQPVNRQQEKQPPSSYPPGTFVPGIIDPGRNKTDKSDGINTNPYLPGYDSKRTQPTFTGTPGDPRLVNGGHYQLQRVQDARGREIPANQQVKDSTGQISWGTKIWRPETGLIPNAQVPQPGRYMRSKEGYPQTPVPPSNDGQQNYSPYSQKGYVDQSRQLSDSNITGSNMAQQPRNYFERNVIEHSLGNNQVPVYRPDGTMEFSMDPHPQPFTQAELENAHNLGLKEHYSNGRLDGFVDMNATTGQSDMNNQNVQGENRQKQHHGPNLGKMFGVGLGVLGNAAYLARSAGINAPVLNRGFSMVNRARHLQSFYSGYRPRY